MKLKSIESNFEKERLIFRFSDKSNDKESFITRKKYCEFVLKEAERAVSKKDIEERMKIELEQLEKEINNNPNTTDKIKESELREITKTTFLNKFELAVRNKLIAEKQKEIGNTQFDKIMEGVYKDCSKYFDSLINYFK